MEAPEKIHIQPNAHDRWFEGKIPLPNGLFVEYIRTDAFIEKAAKWIGEHTSLSEKLVIENFVNYMKGE